MRSVVPQRWLGIVLALAVFVTTFDYHRRLVAQVQSLTPGSSSQDEQRPTPRDPAYLPPLLPRDQREALESGAGNPFLLQGEDLDLAAFLAARRRQEQTADREGNARYREREAERLIRQGRERTLLERSVLDQFGTDGFPSDFGDAPYEETAGRRFSIVFFLAMPITLLASFGLIGLGKTAGGDNSGFTTAESAGGAVVGLALAGWIGWYDYQTVQALDAQERDRLERLRAERNNQPGFKGDPDPAAMIAPENLRNFLQVGFAESVQDQSATLGFVVSL